MRIVSLLVISLVLAVILLTAVTGQVSAIMTKLTLEDLVAGSDLIVIGEVTDVTCYEEGEGNIYTRVTLTVDYIIKGDCGYGVVIRVPGGVVGDIGLLVEDMPGFEEGEQVLVFLKECVDGTWFEDCKGSYMVYGLFQGTVTLRDASGRTVSSYSNIIYSLNEALRAQGIEHKFTIEPTGPVRRPNTDTPPQPSGENNIEPNSPEEQDLAIPPPISPGSSEVPDSLPDSSDRQGSTQTNWWLVGGVLGGLLAIGLCGYFFV